MRKQEQINHILSEFDFQKVHKMMTSVNWQWSYDNNEKKVPSISDLRQVAELCLNKVASSTEENDTFAAGGFVAEKIQNMLELSFVPEKVNIFRQILNKDAKNELARKA